VIAENVTRNAEAELRRADEALRASTVLLREALYNDAISDAYYACFHAIRALPFTLGQEPRSHRGWTDVALAPVTARCLLGCGL
jgi:uncharacterized protein (UPF0332 family)